MLIQVIVNFLTGWNAGVQSLPPAFARGGSSLNRGATAAAFAAPGFPLSRGTTTGIGDSLRTPDSFPGQSVAHDFAGLLALDIAVDAGHPGIDLVHQQPFAQRQDVFGPLDNARRGDLDPRHAPVMGKADQPGHALDAVFGSIWQRAESCRAQRASLSPSAGSGSPRS